MSSPRVNPYESSLPTAKGTGNSTDSRRWPVIVAILACAYFMTSALTLPFSDDVWLGEVPLLAVFQLPKSFLKSVVHGVLMSFVAAIGWSHGSNSPDYIATRTWAMGAMMTVPALVLVTTLMLLNGMPRRRVLITAILLSALLDAIVTFWFEHNSRLSLYNSVYF